jgi:hypothetical protein
MPEPDATARRLAHAVLDGDALAALALADVVLETFRVEQKGHQVKTQVLRAGLSARGRKACWKLCAGMVSWRPPVPVTYYDATLADVAGYTAEDLLAVKNCGKSTLAEVRAKLAAHGLRLRGDPEPEPARA